MGLGPWTLRRLNVLRLSSHPPCPPLPQGVRWTHATTAARGALDTRDGAEPGPSSASTERPPIRSVRALIMSRKAGTERTIHPAISSRVTAAGVDVCGGGRKSCMRAYQRPLPDCDTVSAAGEALTPRTSLLNQGSCLACSRKLPSCVHAHASAAAPSPLLAPVLADSVPSCA